MRSPSQVAWRVKQITCPICGSTRTVHTDNSQPQRCRRCYWDSLRKPEEHKVRNRRENDRRSYWRNPEKQIEEAKRDFALNKEARLATQHERYHKDPQKIRARAAVARAIRAGELEREPCERCGASCTHAHHHDYNLPLDVHWLCSACHGLEHRKD